LSFFDELKRRNVFRVGAAYIVASWVLAQVVDLVLAYVKAPDWVMLVFMLFVAVGFIAAIIIAWAFEMTPEGIKREGDVDRTQSVVVDTGRKLDRIIIGFLAVAVLLLLTDRYMRPTADEVTPSAAEQSVSAETSSAVATPAKSIAVLPFADLSQAQDQEWFADGLAEEILNALAKTPDLQVSSRTSTFRYKGSTLDIPEIAAELGVAHVLEGSVRSSGTRIRVTAQLIRAEDGFHVWSENYDRDEADMIEIQEDLAVSIADALETTMDPAALAEMSQVGTRSVEAYKAFIQGRVVESFAFSEGTGQNFLEARDQYQRATEVDPRFAAAHMSVASFWLSQLEPGFNYSDLTDDTTDSILGLFDESIKLAIQHVANEIDRKFYLGVKAEVEFRLNDALRLYFEVLESRPNDSIVLRQAMGLSRKMWNKQGTSRLDEWYRSAGLRDPDVATDYVGGAYNYLDPNISADYGMEALQRWPNHGSILYQTYRSLLWASRFDEARGIGARTNRVWPDNELLAVRQACAEGRTDDAVNILNSLDPNNHDAFDSNQWLIFKTLGRDAEAAEVWQPYESEGRIHELFGLMSYSIFDPTLYPSLMAILEREGIEKPPVPEIPFKCPPAEGTSIAVLPFVNMSADAENEFFSDGISEEILNVLASIPELKVAARTSAFAYKDSNTNISDIAQELGVNHVLEGSVRKAGNQVRITAQLIQASDGFHLWSENYDRELTNIFAIQDEIAGSIAEALKVTLKLEAGDSGNLTGTNSIKAYEHYLQGMQLWHLRTVLDLERAREEFEASIALDPEFAKAHAGLALYWAVIDGYKDVDSLLSNRNAVVSTDQALVLDPENVEAMSAKAAVLRFQGNFIESEPLFQQAIALNPSFATAYQWYAGALGGMGDPYKGIETYRKAWSIDPRSRIIGYNLAYRLLVVGELEEAFAIMEEVLAFAPEFPDGIDLMMILNMVNEDCEAAQGYAVQLAGLLNKQNTDFKSLQDICQRDDPDLRRQGFEDILSRPTFNFASNDDPGLFYEADILTLLIHYGYLDLLWPFIEDKVVGSGGWTQWTQNFRTPNGIQAQCSPQFAAMVQRDGLPPPVDPIHCE
jgi:TolB-like protein/Tfp pilus assembly protein PilF